MEQLLGSSSPWIEAGILLVAGVLVAAAAGAFVNVVLRRLLGDSKTAGKVSGTVFWVIAAVAFLVAIGRLAQPAAFQTGLGGAATRLLTALPDLLVAILAGVLGWAIAVAVRSVLRRVLDRIRPALADVVAPLAYWAILVLTAFIVAEQLGIQVGLLRAILLVLLGGLVVAAALALGLGARDLVSEVVAGRHVERVVAVGDIVEVGDIRGTVITLGHASVRLANERGEIEVPNGRLLANPVVIVSRASDLEAERAATARPEPSSSA